MAAGGQSRRGPHVGLPRGGASGQSCRRDHGRALSLAVAHRAGGHRLPRRRCPVRRRLRLWRHLQPAPHRLEPGAGGPGRDRGLAGHIGKPAGAGSLCLSRPRFANGRHLGSGRRLRRSAGFLCRVALLAAGAAPTGGPDRRGRGRDLARARIRHEDRTGADDRPGPVGSGRGLRRASPAAGGAPDAGLSRRLHRDRPALPYLAGGPVLLPVRHGLRPAPADG
ncbi:hypothetical protein D3C85_1054050 [compost metagenome]